MDKEPLPPPPLLRSSSGRSEGNVVERNKDTPPCGGVVAVRKSARKETLNWKSFGRAVSGQSCRMLKNKRATSPSPHPSAIISGATGRSVLNFYPPHYFSPIIFLPTRFSRLFLILSSDKLDWINSFEILFSNFFFSF